VCVPGNLLIKKEQKCLPSFGILLSLSLHGGKHFGYSVVFFVHFFKDFRDKSVIFGNSSNSRFIERLFNTGPI
jgi:hypothetical protein